jgi:hypothetical protein
VLSCGSRFAGTEPWRALAQRCGWDVRAIVATDCPAGAAGPWRDTGVVVQTAPGTDLDDLFRRHAGVLTDVRFDGVAVTADPQGIEPGVAAFAPDEAVIRCALEPAALLACASLADVGTFVLSPQAARLLLYLRRPAPERMSQRVSRSCAELLSRHVLWRLHR